MAAPALAGDRALIDYLGYSDDGRYFAFEEFGVQDGSGFPYATVYIVDLSTDTWVDGSPYRALLRDEGADVADARDEAASLAEAKLDALEIDTAADVLAVNGDGEIDADSAHELSYGDPGYGLDAVSNSRVVTLETLPLQSAADCSIIDGDVVGFVLSRDGEPIHEDESPLPQSRGCTQDYKIYAILRPAAWADADSGAVAIIASYPFGFEGPDRRFLAVPLGD